LTLSSALACYVANKAYRRQLLAGAERIDLDGNVAGVVTEDEAQHAKGLLIARRAKKPSRTTPTAAQPAAPPRRDGLADLKAAAQRRKQAMSAT